MNTGLLISPSNVVWPFRIIAYISPVRYSLPLLVYFVFIDSTYQV